MLTVAVRLPLRFFSAHLPDLAVKSSLLIVVSLVTAALSFAAGASWGSKKSTADLESHIFQKSDARKSSGDWGSIHIYTNEETSTYGTDSMLTAELEFLPGKAFAEVESTWKGDKSIFVGSAVEAALPGGGPSAEAKSGFFVNVNAAGEVTDFGLKSSHSTGVGVGPVGYEREVESTFSLMSVLSSPAI